MTAYFNLWLKIVINPLLVFSGNRYGPYGGTGGVHFEAVPPERDCYLACISGRSDLRLDSITFHWRYLFLRFYIISLNLTILLKILMLHGVNNHECIKYVHYFRCPRRPYYISEPKATTSAAATTPSAKSCASSALGSILVTLTLMRLLFLTWHHNM